MPTLTSHAAPGRPFLRTLFALGLALTLAPAASAQINYTWANSGTDWGNGANWIPPGPPMAADTAQFNTFGTTFNGPINNPVINSGVTITQPDVRRTNATRTPLSARGIFVECYTERRISPEDLMGYQTLLIEKTGHVATLTLNRPEARNALDMTMRRELFEALEEIEGDASTRALILTGAGGHFCAGGDVKTMGQSAKASDGRAR